MAAVIRFFIKDSGVALSISTCGRKPLADLFQRIVRRNSLFVRRNLTGVRLIDLSLDIDVFLLCLFDLFCDNLSVDLGTVDLLSSGTLLDLKPVKTSLDLNDQRLKVDNTLFFSASSTRALSTLVSAEMISAESRSAS